MATLVICDIQPEYENYLSFDLYDFIKYLNYVATRYENVVYFYNGYSTLGMIREDELRWWLYEAGLSEKAMEGILFVDKGYAFLREAMDSNVSYTNIVKALRLMSESNLDDSRFLPENIQKKLLNNKSIFWNESFDIMQEYKSLVFIGGGKDECLKELQLGAKALWIKYRFNKKFVY